MIEVASGGVLTNSWLGPTLNSQFFNFLRINGPYFTECIMIWSFFIYFGSRPNMDLKANFGGKRKFRESVVKCQKICMLHQNRPSDHVKSSIILEKRPKMTAL